MENKNKDNSSPIKSFGNEPLKPLRVGIISNETNREDLLFYKSELIAINNKLKGRVHLVIFGFDGDDGDNNWLKGVSFEFVKPTSIIHYFKQLKSLNLDVLFIPLIRSVFNATSENYNKFLEAALFKIPVLTINIYPYNTLIGDKVNGFLFKEKEELIPYLDHLYAQRSLVGTVGNSVYKTVTEEFNYSEENMETISDLFVKNEQ